MKKNLFFLLLILFVSQTLHGQYFKTTFTYSAGLLNFYIKPTGGSINAPLQSFQFDITYPIGANINFGSIINNTTAFPGLNVTATNLFTLNGEWVKRWEHQGAIPQQVYAQNTEYLVFSVPLSGSGSTTLGYKSNYVNFDPVFTVNDDMGTPLWDDTPPYDVYYPNQQQSGDVVYILLNVALPLELSHFGARADQASINLSWATQNEQNFFGFEIQRSTDGIDFSKIAFFEGKGNNESNNYSYIDQEVNPNVVYYYRLKMLDFDGVSRYSTISSASLPVNATNIEIIPNPATEQFHIMVELPEDDIVQAKIYNTDGQLMAQRQSFFSAGIVRWDFDVTDLPKGNYFIQIESSGSVYFNNFILIK